MNTIYQFHIRFSTPVYSDVITHIAEYYPNNAILLVEEDVGLPSFHYHMLLHTDEKINTVRERIRRKLLLVGNKDYSVKNVYTGSGSLEGAQNYICKSKKKKVIYIKCYTDKDVEDFYIRYWETRETIRKEHVDKLANAKEKKVPMIQRMIRSFRCNCSNKNEKYYPCEQCIRTHIVCGYRSNYKGIDASIYRKAYNAILNEHYHNYFLEVWVVHNF